MASTARPTKTGSAPLQRGFTYLGLMLIVACMGAALAATVQVWSTVVQRDRERELLFIGEEFRKALKGFAAAARNLMNAPRERSMIWSKTRATPIRGGTCENSTSIR